MNPKKLKERKARVTKLDRALKNLFPKAKIELNFKNPLELLVAVQLSAQCTDKMVNRIAEKLFKKYRKLEDYVRADPREFEQDIRSCGYYRSKTKNILGMAKMLKKEFGGKEPRTVHLGIDLWAAPGTAVLAPLAGTVHSFANNPAAGDYGPTIVLEHVLQGVRFCTLYGHLSLSSLHGLGKGTAFLAGQRMATIGRPPTNGNWPPHLHFQIIRDMLGKRGDFFGVAPLSQRAELLDLCPDPNRILRIAKLRSERR